MMCSFSMICNNLLLILGGNCVDKVSQCQSYANAGYCQRSYVAYMKQNCRKSCNLCRGKYGLSGC